VSATAQFPAADTPAAFDAVRRDESLLRPGVAAVCARLGLDPASARRFPDGSLPVYAVGPGSVLKFYPPCFAEERDREAAALGIAEGKLGVPTPGVESTGELDGWGYLRMTRLAGTSLAAAWPDIPAGDHKELARELGEALARLHALRDSRLAALGPHRNNPLAPGLVASEASAGKDGFLDSGWERFLAAQRAGCAARQASLGLAAPWLDAIDPFLAGVNLGDGAPGALLHTEIMREHLLVAPGPWRLTGLFDFEPAMTGAPEYEFASVGLFFSCGDAAVFRAVLDGYGRAPDPGFARRCLAYALLHRYSNLPWYLERLPASPGTRLADLADLWWGSGERA